MTKLIIGGPKKKDRSEGAMMTIFLCFGLAL